MEKRIVYYEKELTYYEMLCRAKGINHRRLFPDDKAAELSRLELQLNLLKDPESIEDNNGGRIWLSTIIWVILLSFFDNPVGNLFDWVSDVLLLPLHKIFKSGIIDSFSGFISEFFICYIVLPVTLGLVTYIPWRILYEKVLKKRKQKKFAKLTEKYQCAYDALLNDGRDRKTDMLLREKGGTDAEHHY